MMQDATPVIRVSDYARARGFYAGQLGFDVIEEGGDPARFGIFRRDKAQLFINAWDGAGAAYEGWVAYIHVADIAATKADLDARSVAFVRGPVVTEYGMAEIEIADPDGNVICFGADA
ncbi:MAG: glyoxalase superfamily protein [Pseudomonadota bacterium]